MVSVHHAIGGHFRYWLCHVPIIAPPDIRRQASFTERLRLEQALGDLALKGLNRPVAVMNGPRFAPVARR
jgi:hypothetical protein